MDNGAKIFNFVKLWLLIGIPILFALGALLHFAYNEAGVNDVTKLFLPVNESVWEHVKLFFWPVLLWYVIGYIILSHKKHVSFFKWTVSLAAAQLFGVLFIPAFSFAYTGAFGPGHILWLDIAAFFVALALALILSYHINKYSKRSTFLFIVSLIIIIIIGAAIVYFTFCPPDIPLFKSI